MDALMPRPRTNAASTGVWVGIATISMSFAAYTSAMVVRRGAASDWQHFPLPPVIYINTLILLASSATLEIGRRRMAQSPPRSDPAVVPLHAPAPLERLWFLLTLWFGILFVVGQLLVWRVLAREGLYLATNPSSAFFYIFTALHALHLLGGIAALTYGLRRSSRSAPQAMTRMFGAIALYWHFMGVLWCYLLVVLMIAL
jgi:cytochrome c oxidase subunit 3